ncbi:MAG: hypothetical protein FRX48_03460 [Lasallia pustulata]|uniref:Secreted protein n=1 Tax=Lasallia pustulata TaxID=136370 RepID=A0A5M8PTV7_9LECA|nr:MAG: hypothetical protein FRX48_03460 [Lasallia pustulata]
MHALPIPFCTTLLLLSLTAYTSAAISFTPRVYCANYPQTVAGTPISKRALPFPPTRTPTPAPAAQYTGARRPRAPTSGCRSRTRSRAPQC